MTRQRLKIVACIVLFVATVFGTVALLYLAGKPGNEWMVLAAVGVDLAAAIIASTLIMSYLNADNKARGLRWKY